MAIELSCRCGAAFVLPPALGGQQVRCPSCEASLTVPEPLPASPPPPRDEPRFAVVRVDCACGRRVATPAQRLRRGQARCPSCDQVLV